MKFNLSEKEHIKEIVSIQDDNLSEYLPDKIFDFLKETKKIQTIRDDLFFSLNSKFRPYDYCRLTKFIRPEFDLKQLLDDLLSEISGPYLIFIDFHFTLFSFCYLRI